MSWRDLAEVTQEACLDVFRETDADGASSVTYHPVGAAARVLERAIFSEPHVEQDVEGSTAPASTWETWLDVKIADLLPQWPLERGARFTVARARGGDPRETTPQVYRWWDIRLDGEGLVRIMLEPGELPS